MNRGRYFADVKRTSRHSVHRCAFCLSDREIEVLVEIAAGKGRSEVAAALHMSTANVAYHLSGLNRKFQVKGQAAVVAAALVAGVLTSDRWPVLSTSINCISALFDSLN